MSIYSKENPSFFETSVNSMLSQTIKPDEIILVCDGPLTSELDKLIDEYSKNSIFNIIRLNVNKGLSNALNIGIRECKNEYILRMDSDDISLPYRAEKELKILDSGYDIVGSFISEFVDDSSNVKGYRKVPVDHKSIVKFSKRRSPFNHPSVAFKKSSILKSGNYSLETRYMQDYYLWVRCIQNGCKCFNIPEVLVNMRSGISMRSRRKGKEFAKSYKIVFKYMLKSKYINPIRYIQNIVSFFFYSHLSPNLKEQIVYKFLRSKTK